MRLETIFEHMGVSSAPTRLFILVNSSMRGLYLVRGSSMPQLDRNAEVERSTVSQDMSFLSQSTANNI